jgi:hypothetical protein
LALPLAQVPCEALRGGEGFIAWFFGFWSPSTGNSGFYWCKTLEECLLAVIFVVIEEFFEFPCCCGK